MDVKKFFDHYWKEESLRRFDRYYEFVEVVNKNLYSKLSEHRGKRVLAIGVGNSTDLDFLNQLTSEIVSVDISYYGLKESNDFMRVQMDANLMGFKAHSFDVVFMRTVFLHLQHRRTLLEIRRILQEGGTFFWIEPMKNNIFLWLYRLLISPGRFTDVDYLTYDEILAMKSMFHHFWHSEYYLFTVFLIPIYLVFPWMRKVVRFFVSLEQRVLSRFECFRRFCWISYGYAEV